MASKKLVGFLDMEVGKWYKHDSQEIEIYRSSKDLWKYKSLEHGAGQFRESEFRSKNACPFPNERLYYMVS